MQRRVDPGTIRYGRTQRVAVMGSIVNFCRTGVFQTLLCRLLFSTRYGLLRVLCYEGYPRFRFGVYTTRTSGSVSNSN